MSHIEEIFFNSLKWLMIIKWDTKAPTGTFLSQLLTGQILRKLVPFEQAVDCLSVDLGFQCGFGYVSIVPL